MQVSQPHRGRNETKMCSTITSSICSRHRHCHNHMQWHSSKHCAKTVDPKQRATLVNTISNSLLLLVMYPVNAN